MAQKFLNGVHISGTVQLDFMPDHESEGIITLGRYDSNTSRYHNIKSYVSSTEASNYLKFSLHNGTENAIVDVLTLNGNKSATFAGQVIFPSTATTKPVLPNGFISRNDLDDTSGRHDIWGISERYYPSSSTAGDAWGIQWSGTPNDIVFVGGGTDRFTVSLDEGNITSTGSATFEGTITLSSDASTFINLANTTSSTGKTWRVSSAPNGKLYITEDGVVDAIILDNTTGNAQFAGTVTATHFYGNGSNLTSVDADTVDNLHAASFLRSDADDTATGIISVTKKLHDYDTIPPNQNLLDIGSIKISNRNDIYGNATKTVITDYVAKYVNDNTGETTIRIYVDDNILVDGNPYMVSVYYENLIGSLAVDFADTAITGNGSQTGTSSAPKSGRIYGYATRADYTSTYRFVDINLSQGSGHEVTLHSPKVEAGTTLTDFVATERTDMPTNSMHVKDLIATGGLQVIGPASHNFIQSENDYTLGFSDSTGTSQWWIKTYTNGGFALHENGVGDKFNIAAGGNATFANNIFVTGTSSTFNTGNSGTFVTNDANNYPRLTMTSASAQLGLYRAGDGGMYIGGSSSGFRIYTESFSQKFLLDQSGNATFAGNVKVKSALIDNASVTSATTTTTVASVSGTTYAAVFFDYVIYKSSNIRAGTVVACSDGTSVSFTETSTTDLGDTSDVTLAVDLSSSNFRLRATTTSSTWNIKSLIRAI